MKFLTAVFMFSSWLFALIACKKEPNPTENCIPVFYKKGARIWEDTSAFSQAYPDFKYQKAFISSGFTPNGDYLNDQLMIDVYWQGELLYNDQIPNDWRIQVKIMQEGITVFNYQSIDDDGWFSVGWNGKDLIGITKPGLYEVRVQLFYKDLLLETFKGYSWLLLPDAQNKLPAWARCLKFPSNYDGRLGLIYEESNEKFH